MEKLKVLKQQDLPVNPFFDALYVLEPKNFSLDYYLERTDRNIGWITKEEQMMLHGSTVGIAGCGGMGGLIASIFLRLGVGTIVIFEPEIFDISNINRQFGATRSSVGKSKAFETARMLREIADDTRIVVCPQGLTEENVDVLGDFIERCDVVFDEIELWALGARCTLHDITRRMKRTVLNCNTIGHRTNLFCFTEHGLPFSECIGIDTNEAWRLQRLIQAGNASVDQKLVIKDKVMKLLIPTIPEYSLDPEIWSTQKEWDRRLMQEGTAIVIATNPPMASGFAANHGLFQILKKSEVKRNFIYPPEMPGYIMFDAATMETTRIEKHYW